MESDRTSATLRKMPSPRISEMVSDTTEQPPGDMGWAEGRVGGGGPVGQEAEACDGEECITKEKSILFPHRIWFLDIIDVWDCFSSDDI